MAAENPEIPGNAATITADARAETASSLSAGASRLLMLPGYEILERLGQGGMGIVYKAQQVALRRLVAVKVISALTHDDPARQRFRNEAVAIARLQHPHVVQVFETGTADGQPYMVLELVGGGSLADKLQGKPQPARAAAALVANLAEAVQAAHAAGVIHRDLKPANVLLTEDGTPKISDFGLAKHLAEEHGQTQTGAVMGTPSYMAPEQAMGLVKELGPAVDIYALGAVLYECLTGRPPFRGTSMWETVAMVKEHDPVPPRQLQPGVPTDLQTICLTCLRKEPGRRYATAAELAADLSRFLAGEPIQARPTGQLERAAKWIRRRPVLAASYGVIGIAALVILILCGALWYNAESRATAVRQLGEAETSLAELRRQADELHQANAIEQQRLRETKEEADRLQDEAKRGVFALQLTQALALGQKDPGRGLELLDNATRCPPYLREFTWGLAKRFCRRELGMLPKQSSNSTALAIAPDGTTLATDGPAGAVQLWDAPTGKETRRLPGTSAPVVCVAYAADSASLASGHEDGTVHVWDLAAGKSLSTFRVMAPDGRRARPHSLAFGRKDKLLAVVGSSLDYKGTGGVWDWASANRLDTIPSVASIMGDVAWTPDGNALLIASKNDGLRWFDVAKGKDLGPLPCRNGAAFWCVAVSPDGRRAAATSADGTAVAWDLANKQQIATLQGSAAGAFGLSFAKDSRTLAVGYNNHGWIKLWDTETGSELLTLGGHPAPAMKLGHSADGRYLASRSSDGTVKLWNASNLLESATLRSPLVQAGQVTCLAFSPDGKNLAVGSGVSRFPGVVAVWNPVTASFRKTLAPQAHSIQALAYSADGSMLATAAAADQEVWLRDAQSDQLRAKFSDPVMGNYSVAFAPDGKTLAVGYGVRLAAAPLPAPIKLWDIVSNKVRAVLDGHGGAVYALAYAPDGSLLASGSSDNTVRLWDPTTGEPRGKLEGHTGRINALAFSPDGNTLASAAEDGAVRLWDTKRLSERRVLRDFQGGVLSVAFSPDGRTLATGSKKAQIFGEAKLWDPVTGQLRASLPGHESWVPAVAFSPDGKTLATAGSGDRVVKLWRVDEQP